MESSASVAVGVRIVCLTLGLAACGGGQPAPAPEMHGGGVLRLHRSSSSLIEHVIIMVQENRTPDYLFQGVPGADIAKSAIDSHGDRVPLKPVSLAARYDLPHGHVAFVTDYDGGKMDGFDIGLKRREKNGPYGYAPHAEVRPYDDMARQYVLADRMFQTNQGGSFPAHQYFVSGTASALPETPFNVSSEPFNRLTLKHAEGGCDAMMLAAVNTINPQDGSNGPVAFPCFDRPVLSDFLDRQGISWRYYQHDLGAGIWHALDAIRHVRDGPDYVNVVTPPQSIISDVSSGHLPGVSWVMPADDWHSDHAGNGSSAGPSWVAAVVNAVGKSRYWDSTAILITWDDWGGWYDHVPPQQMDNSYELGFRVPLLVISPYAKRGYVAHVQYEFGSLLAFAEETFGIPKGALGTTDVRANSLTDAFDFTQQPRVFVPIKAPPFKPAPSPAANIEDP
jgi:phospholipase C